MGTNYTYASEPTSAATVVSYNAQTHRWITRSVHLLNQYPQPDEVCYIFVENGTWFKGEGSEGLRRRERRELLSRFKLPDIVTSQFCTDLNGFFGCHSSITSTPIAAEHELLSLVTWFRILTKKVFKQGDQEYEERCDHPKEYYKWFEMGFFTHWNGNGTGQVLCIDTPPELRKYLFEDGAAATIDLRHPFGMIRPLLDAVLECCNSHTWRLAKHVREVEKQRLDRPDFEKLQNLARHACHLVEVQDVAADTILQIANKQKEIFKLRLPEDLGRDYTRNAQDYAAFQAQMMKSLKKRSDASYSRLQGEISLAYNMLAITDNQVMKSVALLTMVFLPGTFISALFSTTFFQLDGNKWKFSEQFWLYWVTCLPVTTAVVFIWYFWLGGSQKKIQHKWLNKRTKKRTNSIEM